MFWFFGVKKKNKAYLEEIKRKIKLYEQNLAKFGINNQYFDMILLEASQIPGNLKKSQVFAEYVEQVMNQAAQDLEAARKKEARARDITEKFESIIMHVISIREKIKCTKNDFMIHEFQNLNKFLSTDGLKKTLAFYANDSSVEKLTLIKENISKLESMANAHPNPKHYDVLSKSPMPPLFKIGSKSLLTLLESCLTSKTILQQCHVNSIKTLNAYKIWANRDQLSFLSTGAKALQREAEPLDAKIDVLSCAEYYKMRQLLDRIEDEVMASIAAIKGLDLDNITIVHKDWLKFVASSQDIRPQLALLSEPGFLSVKGMPKGADVYVDGSRAGSLPLQKALFWPGTYAVQVTAKYCDDVNETVRITSGEETLLKVELGRTCPITGMEFVPINPGEFMMGSNDREAYNNEKPVHKVRISKGFYLGKYPVTQAQWERVMGDNPSYFTGNPNNPVEEVSWNDVQDFIARLNAQEGTNSYRLPTEAEWEYAAKGGNRSRGYKYAGSNTVDEVAWIYYNSGGTTHPVGTKAPNELGLYDMSGNVWEWCRDAWDEQAYSRLGREKDPEVTGGGGSYRVYRGGSWSNGPGSVRAAFRDGDSPADRDSFLGFRLLRTL